MKKTLCLLFLTILLLVLMALPTIASDDIAVQLDGQQIVFDVQPQLINSRTMVPLRAILEALGATVNWNDDTQTVTSTKGDTTISLTINNSTMYVNEATVTLDSPACLVSGRTLVPVRAISESFGVKVKWEDSIKTVLLSTSGEFVEPNVTMYAADGRTKFVPQSQVEANKAVGWYTEPLAKMYAADGRTKFVPQSQVEANKAVGWYTYPVTTILVAGGQKYVAPIDLNAYNAYKSILDKSLAGIMDDNDFYKMYTDKVHRNAKVEKTLYAYLFDITGDGKEELFLKENTNVSSGAGLDNSTCDEWIRVFTYTEKGIKRIGQTLSWVKNNGETKYGVSSYSYYEPIGYIGGILSSVDSPHIMNECLYYCLGADGKQYLSDYMPKYKHEKNTISFYAYNGNCLEKVCTIESSFLPSWYISSSLHSDRGSYLYYVNGERVSESVYREYLNKYTGGGAYILINNDCSEVINKLNSVTN